MLVVNKVKKTKLHVVTYMRSTVTGELWCHLNSNLDNKSYLIRVSDL